MKELDFDEIYIDPTGYDFWDFGTNAVVPMSMGVAELYVKDESKRFGLNAFKVLGGSWCIGRYIAKKLNVQLEEPTYERLTSPETRSALAGLTFVTATDGNHGRGIAWTAARLGLNSVVYMPKGSARERLENIRALGTKAEITPWSYDDTVRYASRQAEGQGWVLVQDTSWEGYEEIPGWIMEGYTTLALEAAEQLGDVRPTHLFLQAGVEAMAGAVAGFFTSYYEMDCPIITVVEPHNANCMFRTAQAGDGKLHSVTGDLNTIMAGLACGEPCAIAWDSSQRNRQIGEISILRKLVDNFVLLDELLLRRVKLSAWNYYELRRLRF